MLALAAQQVIGVANDGDQGEAEAVKRQLMRTPTDTQLIILLPVSQPRAFPSFLHSSLPSGAEKRYDKAVHPSECTPQNNHIFRTSMLTESCMASQ